MALYTPYCVTQILSGYNLKIAWAKINQIKRVTYEGYMTADELYKEMQAQQEMMEMLGSGAMQYLECFFANFPLKLLVFNGGWFP